MPDSISTPRTTLMLVSGSIHEYHDQIERGVLIEHFTPDAKKLNMVLSEVIKAYRLWPSGVTPAKNQIRLDFIFLITGAGGGFSELDDNWIKAFWRWAKPYRDMSGSGYWHMNDNAGTLMCKAMREHYEAKLPQPIPLEAEVAHE